MDRPEGSVSGCDGDQQTATLPLPAAFLDFLSENGLDPAVYSMAATIPRYIRWEAQPSTNRLTPPHPRCIALVTWLRTYLLHAVLHYAIMLACLLLLWTFFSKYVEEGA
jgi:hypothetical protein